MSKNLYIKTYGCQMNVYDSDCMAELLKPHGYEQCESVDTADMVILNTCHIREKAAEKMYSELGRVRQHKENKNKQGENCIIAVAGCVGQAEGKEIFKRAPFVDMVVGPQSYQTLPDLLSSVKRNEGHKIDLSFSNKKFDTLNTKALSGKSSTFLTIQEGCDKFCTFCVVPYTRGAEYSRPVSEIYREAMQLVANGTKEITLLGQNVNAYQGKTEESNHYNLGQLIRHLCKINGLERIRYSTSHPRDMHDELYKVHFEEEKVMPFLNLPVQSGSDKILQAMNRKHTRDSYFEIIDKLRDGRPEMQFSTDIIVGFPGESDKDFEDTVDLVKRVNYTQAYSFKYSPRPGTPGADMEEQIPEHIKDERLQYLQAIINQQQERYNKNCEGKKMAVLFDRKGKRENQYVGKTPFMQSVHVTSEKNGIINAIKEVAIKEGFANSLSGQLL